MDWKRLQERIDEFPWVERILWGSSDVPILEHYTGQKVSTLSSRYDDPKLSRRAIKKWVEDRVAEFNFYQYPENNFDLQLRLRDADVPVASYRTIRMSVGANLGLIYCVKGDNQVPWVYVATHNNDFDFGPKPASCKDLIVKALMLHGPRIQVLAAAAESWVQVRNHNVIFFDVFQFPVYWEPSEAGIAI